MLIWAFDIMALFTSRISADLIFCSPIDVPLVEEEPFLGLGAVDMYILINATNDEEFVIVSDWLCSVELFRLLEGAIHALYLTHFRV